MKKFLLSLTITLTALVGFAQTTVYHVADDSKTLTLSEENNVTYTASVANPNMVGNTHTNVSSILASANNGSTVFILTNPYMPNGTNTMNLSFDYYTATAGGNNSGSGRYIVRLYNSVLGDSGNTVRENIAGAIGKTGGA
jgi:hypothetical protein